MNHHTTQYLGWFVRGCCLAVVVVCAGCTEFKFRGYQASHPRSLEELYAEASASRMNYPEQTVAPYAGEVLSPHSPLDPVFPPPPVAPVPAPTYGPTIGTNRSMGAIRRASAVGLGEGGVQLAQALGQMPADSGPHVSEIFEDTDIRQAIQALATQAGVSVVVDEQVGGITTAFIEDEPFEQALRKVLMPLGLVYRYRDNQYLVGTGDPTSALFPMIAETYEYRPQHLAPAELLPLLPERLQVFVRVIEKRNLMIVEAPRESALQIVEQLQQSDMPVPQVLLEAMVCVFNPNQTFQFSADLRQSLSLDGTEVLDIGTLGLAVSGFVSPIGLEKAFSDFGKTSAFLRLLAQEGYVTIRATPRVMAKDGEKASIKIERETYFALQPQSADIIFRQDVQKVDAGIVLDIVPVIRGDMVTVTIERAEVSEDIREIDRTTTNLLSQFPLINRRQVSTTVHVKDGQTIVIGGLMQRQTVDRFSHVPYLHAIPVFGRLFERVDQEDKTAEVAIFISPRIIQPTVAPIACPAAELLPSIESEIPPPAVLSLPPAAAPALVRPPYGPVGEPVPVLPAPSPASSPVPSAPVPESQSRVTSPTVPVAVDARAESIASPSVPESAAAAPELIKQPPGIPSEAPTELRFVLPKPIIRTSPPETTP